MTNDEFVTALRTSFQLNKQISDLQDARRAEEAALVVQYKVDECNQARQALALKYQDQITALQIQVNSIRIQLGA